jgi:hypothetical protein
VGRYRHLGARETESKRKQGIREEVKERGKIEKKLNGEERLNSIWKRWKNVGKMCLEQGSEEKEMANFDKRKERKKETTVESRGER